MEKNFYDEDRKYCDREECRYIVGKWPSDLENVEFEINIFDRKTGGYSICQSLADDGARILSNRGIPNIVQVDFLFSQGALRK